MWEMKSHGIQDTSSHPAAGMLVDTIVWVLSGILMRANLSVAKYETRRTQSADSSAMVNFERLRWPRRLRNIKIPRP